MSNNNQQITASFPFFSVLTLIFITLKLTGYIAWSWWWVLAPIWIPFCVFFAILAIVFFVTWGKS